MATGYGFTGPMTARDTTFDAKAESSATSSIFLPLMGAGSWFLVLYVLKEMQ